MKSAQAGAPPKGSRGNAPCGVQRRRLWWGLGQRPNCRTGDQLQGANKGAGSEASLPLTLRSRRSAPNSLYQLLAHCRAGWARPTSMGSIRLFMLVFYIAGKTAFASLIIPSSLSLPAPPPRPLKSPARFARIPIPLRGAGCKPFSVSADEKRPPARLQTVWKNGITPRLPQ